MTAKADAGWERHPNGAYISIPIDARDLDEVRAWLAENRGVDFLRVLGRRVVFERREDLRWRW